MGAASATAGPDEQLIPQAWLRLLDHRLRISVDSLHFQNSAAVPGQIRSMTVSRDARAVYRRSTERSGSGCCRSLLLVALLGVPRLLVADAETLAGALAEHGGPALGDLQSVTAETRLVDTWAWQSRRPDPPWDGAIGSRRYALDFRARRYAEDSHWVASGNYPFRSLIVSDGADSFVANLDEGYWRRDDTDFRSRILDFQLLLAPLVLRDASPVTGGEQRESAAGLLPVRATLADQTLLLLIDRDSHRLHQLERTLPDGARELIAYDGYERIDGVLFNRVARIHYRGTLAREVHFRVLETGVPVGDRFQLPPDLEEYVVESDPEARKFAARRLADGVWFIGEGVHYQLFVEFDDFVVALGSVGGVERRLEELARRVPGKPVRYAMVSHHHSDHLEGVRKLAEAGAVLLTAPAHEGVVRAELAGSSGAIETIADERVFSDPHQELRILQIGPNSHTEQMLAGYLPDRRLLFTADLFVQPPERPIRARIPPIRDLAIAIAAFGLEVDMLLDPHSPRVNAMSDLETALAR